MNTTDMDKALRNLHNSSLITPVKRIRPKQKIISKRAFKRSIIHELIECHRFNKVMHYKENCNECIYHHECKSTIEKLIPSI